MRSNRMFAGQGAAAPLRAAAGALALVLALAGPAAAEEPARAILAGGCFWCVEHDLEPLPGVIGVVSGYAGGSREAPTYSTYNRTDSANPVPHIEVVEVLYDPSVLSRDDLVAAFLRRIDPTDGGGQFCDRGPGYRPAIFVADAAEREAAEAALAAVSRELGVETQVAVLDDAPFWPAEAYHQDYAARNPVAYRYYRWACGRDQRIRALWGEPAG